MTKGNSTLIVMNGQAPNYTKTFLHELSHASIWTEDLLRNKIACWNHAQECAQPKLRIEELQTIKDAECVALFITDLLENNEIF